MRTVARLQAMTSKSTSEAKEVKYSCDRCKDTRLIQTGPNSYRQCECIARDKVNRSWRESGLSVEQLENKTYKTFLPWNPKVKSMKDIATSYATAFHKIRGQEKRNSLFLSGTPGCGKTHLAIATAGYLMSKKINVMYMPYMEVAFQIKQYANQDGYTEKLSKYKKAEVLLIDDLLKNEPTNADINILFQIMDYRDRAHLPVIISSERTSDYLLNWNEGVGRRIYDMCKGHIVENMEKGNNYSLKK